VRRRARQLLRVGTRGTACVGVTVGALGCYDAVRRFRPQAEHHGLMHHWLARWARTSLRVLGVELHAEGRHVERREIYPGRGPSGVGRVFVMNHRSGLDIPVALAIARAHLVSRHDLASWPLVGHGARTIGTLFVDRSSMRSGATVLRAMCHTLEEGCGVTIFPEGTAFAGDEVRPFRPGAFTAAQRTGAEIVPIGIAYAEAEATYGDESFGDHLKRVAAMGELHAALQIGEPIQPADRSAVELRNLTRTAVQALVDQARGRLEVMAASAK
jgi:1-acyl-sn-glycerol-3-phosphate acyltransferase